MSTRTHDGIRGRVFVNGTFTTPRLDHPECVAIHPDGSIWCGGEAGQIFRIEPDGSRLEQVASTGGFVLGIAFDAASNLYVCDLLEHAVFRLDARTRRLEQFADGAAGRRFIVPNSVAVDASGRLYVSDSNEFGSRGPGIYRFAADGSGELWHKGPFRFANGIALAPDGSALFVVESELPGISRIAIGADSLPGPREVIMRLDGTFPDGIAFGPDGLLYVGCYEPSQILRRENDGSVTVVLADPIAHLLCHPTNLAFRASELFAANLGRSQITIIEGAV